MGIVTVDDRDPSISYSTDWSQAGTSLENNSTTTWTDVDGSTASISFFGSSIGVYGTFAINDGDMVAPVSLYSIDGGSPVSFAPDLGDSTQYHQLFFQSPVLPEAEHLLTITFTGSGAQANPLVLDFFMVDEATLPVESPLTTSLISSSDPAPFSIQSTVTTMISSTPQSPPQSLPSSPLSSLSPSFSIQESSSLSPTLAANPGVATVLVQWKSSSETLIAHIIGGALGTLAFICIVLLYLRRRRQERHSDVNRGGPAPIGYARPQIQLHPSISPYDLSHTPQHRGKGQPFAGTVTGIGTTLVTTSSFPAGIAQRSSQQALAADTTSALLGNMTNSKNLGSEGVLLNTPSIYGDPGTDPPPSYR